jgi:hypothetical protein
MKNILEQFVEKIKITFHGKLTFYLENFAVYEIKLKNNL